MKGVETQSSHLRTLLPSPLTEWLVPHAQTLEYDCLNFFSFKGRNTSCRKAIVLDVHSTPGALKEARKMRGSTTSDALYHPPQILHKHFAPLHASILSNLIIRCLLLAVSR